MGGANKVTAENLDETGAASLYSVWREGRAENIAFGIACARARDGLLPGVIPGPNGIGLAVPSSARSDVKAALRRAA